jgi:hypothetical protein
VQHVREQRQEVAVAVIPHCVAADGVYWFTNIGLHAVDACTGSSR